MTDQTQETAPLSPTATRILGTAKRLFMQRGYRAVSVNDIVHAAEITKPTLYYHFADKEELFVQMALTMLVEMHTKMAEALADKQTTAARLLAVATVVESADGDTRMMRHEIREHLSPAQQMRLAQRFERSMIEPLREVMRAGLERGELAGHSAEILSWLFLQLMEGFHNDEGRGAEPGSAHLSTTRVSAETLVDLFLHGVAPRDAR